MILLLKILGALGLAMLTGLVILVLVASELKGRRAPRRTR